MIGYHTLGQLPPKPHIEFRSGEGWRPEESE